MFIISTTILCMICCLGLLNVEEDTSRENWVPKESEYWENYQWLGKNFKSPFREQSILIVAKEGESILSARNIQVKDAI